MHGNDRFIRTEKQAKADREWDDVRKWQILKLDKTCSKWERRRRMGKFFVLQWTAVADDYEACFFFFFLGRISFRLISIVLYNFGLISTFIVTRFAKWVWWFFISSFKDTSMTLTDGALPCKCYLKDCLSFVIHTMSRRQICISLTFDELNTG